MKWMFHPAEACWWSSRRYSVCWQKLSLHHLNLNKWLVDSEAGSPRLFHRHGLRRGRSGRWFRVFWYLSPEVEQDYQLGFSVFWPTFLNNSLPRAEKFCCKSLRQSQEESTQSDEEAKKQVSKLSLRTCHRKSNPAHYPLSTYYPWWKWMMISWFRWLSPVANPSKNQLEIRWLAFQRSVMWRTML